MAYLKGQLSNEAYGLLSFKTNRGDANLADMKVRDLGKARIIFIPTWDRTQIGWFDTTTGLNTYEKWAAYALDGLNTKRPASGRAPWPTMLVMSAASTGLVLSAGQPGRYQTGQCAAWAWRSPAKAEAYSATSSSQIHLEVFAIT